MIDKTEEAQREDHKKVDIDEEAAPEADSKVPTERQPLIPPTYQAEAGPSTTSDTPFPTRPSMNMNQSDRPRTVRHHRRTLSGRSINSGQFGPSFHPSIYPAVNSPFTRQAKRAADSRARARFVKALAMGIGLWLLIGLILGWTGFQELSRGRLDYGQKPIVPPSEGEPFACANFSSTDKPFSAPLPKGFSASTAKFAIPLGSDDLFFVHGKGSFAKGKIDMELVPGGGDVNVVVEARYNDDRLVDLMQVCEVRDKNRDGYGKGREIGLGIYTPKPDVGPYPDSDLDFAVQIRIPQDVKQVYTLEIRGELFAIHVADLTAIEVERIDFESTNARIKTAKIQAHAVRVRTSNGAIEGTFNVSSSLSLASNNGAIRAKVALFPRSKEDDDLPDLPPNPPADGIPDAPSPPARIQKSEKKETTVHATTTNGAVSLEYTEHPIGQVLYSYAASTNGRVGVAHTPGFEGNFEAETTWGSARIDGPESNTDPSGKGRSRKKEIRTDRKELGYRHITGTIWWSESGKDENKRERGETKIRTTLGSARIDFL